MSTETALRIIDEREVLGKPFRIYGTFENPLFLAKDVAEWIEHTDVSTMVRNVEDDEKLVQTLFVSGQHRDLLFLTEQGVYEILFLSRKPVAKEFKKQVKAILHEIRTKGYYVKNDTDPMAISVIKELATKLDNAEKLLVQADEKILDMRDQVKKFETSDGMFRVHEVAMILYQRHRIGKGTETDLVNSMIERGMLQKDQSAKRGKIVRPYKKHMDAGYFSMEMEVGSVCQCHIVVTPKGFCWIESTFLGLHKIEYENQRPLFSPLNQHRLFFDSPHETLAPMTEEQIRFVPKKPR